MANLGRLPLTARPIPTRVLGEFNKEDFMSNCPECGGVLKLSPDVIAHEILDCPTCGTELEVMSVDPIKIALAPEEEEDWGE